METKGLMMDLYRHLMSDEFDSIRRFGSGSDISYLDGIYLDMILLNDGCTPSMISERLGIARSAVTVRLNRLEKEGLVTRTRSEKDKRSTVLALTDRALEDYRPMFESFDRYDRILNGSFTEQELDVIRRAMECIIRDARGAPGSLRLLLEEQLVADGHDLHEPGQLLVPMGEDGLGLWGPGPVGVPLDDAPELVDVLR